MAMFNLKYVVLSPKNPPSVPRPTSPELVLTGGVIPPLLFTCVYTIVAFFTWNDRKWVQQGCRRIHWLNWMLQWNRGTLSLLIVLLETPFVSERENVFLPIWLFDSHVLAFGSHNLVHVMKVDYLLAVCLFFLQFKQKHNQKRDVGWFLLYLAKCSSPKSLRKLMLKKNISMTQ